MGFSQLLSVCKIINNTKYVQVANDAGVLEYVQASLKDLAPHFLNDEFKRFILNNQKATVSNIFVMTRNFNFSL